MEGHDNHSGDGLEVPYTYSVLTDQDRVNVLLERLKAAELQHAGVSLQMEVDIAVMDQLGVPEDQKQAARAGLASQVRRAAQQAQALQDLLASKRPAQPGRQ